MSTVAGTTPYPWPWDGGLDAARLALLAVGCPHPDASGLWDMPEASETALRIALLAGIVRRAGGLILAIEVRAPASARLREAATEGETAAGMARIPAGPADVGTAGAADVGTAGAAEVGTAGAADVGTAGAAGLAGTGLAGTAGTVAVSSGTVPAESGGGVAVLTGEAGTADAPAASPNGDGPPEAGRAALRPDHVIRAAGWSGFHGSELDAVLRAERRDLLLLTGCCLETAVHSTMRAANDRGYECLLVADACASADPALTANALSTIEMSGGIFGAVGGGVAVAEALLPLVTERTMA